MDTVVNPPQPGEPSYETWKAEVDTTIASLKRSGIYLPVALLLDLALHSILTMGHTRIPLNTDQIRYLGTSIRALPSY